MAKIHQKYKGDVYDDRDPTNIFYTVYTYTDDEAYSHCRNYINMMFKDPDDGVIPSHITYKVEKVKNV